MANAGEGSVNVYCTQPAYRMNGMVSDNPVHGQGFTNLLCGAVHL